MRIYGISRSDAIMNLFGFASKIQYMIFQHSFPVVRFRLSHLRCIFVSDLDQKDMDERLETILAKYEQEMKILREKVEALEKSVETLKRSVDTAPAESIELIHEDFLPDITEVKSEELVVSAQKSSAEETPENSDEGASDVEAECSVVEAEENDMPAEDTAEILQEKGENKEDADENPEIEPEEKGEQKESVFASGETISEKLSHSESAQEELESVQEESESALDDMPGEDEEFSLFGELMEEPAKKTVERPKAVRTLNDANASKVHKSISDAAAAKQAWRNDIPGPEVKDVRSAISLNDRVMFISTLFRDDSMLFQDVVSRINSLNNLEKIVPYLEETFPEWNMDSDLVYRFMMAVRRKVR